MAKNIIIIPILALSFHALYGMVEEQEPVVKLSNDFRTHENNLEKLTKFQRHVNKIKPDTNLSPGFIKNLKTQLSNRITFLKTKNELAQLEDSSKKLIISLARLEAIQEDLLSIVQREATEGINTEEKNIIETRLLPLTQLLINTQKLFQSNTIESIKLYLPVSENDDTTKLIPIAPLRQNAEGDTILHVALKKMLPVNTIDYLLKCDDTIHARNSHLQTPLHTAVLSKNDEGLKLLLSYTQQIPVPTAVNDQDDQGQTPLHKACLKKYHRSVQLLLEHQASVYITDTHKKKAGDYLFDSPWTHESTLIAKYLVTSHDPALVCTKNVETFQEIKETDENMLAQVTEKNAKKYNSPGQSKQIRTLSPENKSPRISRSPESPRGQKRNINIFSLLKSNNLQEEELDGLSEDQINTLNATGTRPLSWAIANKPEYVEILLKKNANPNLASTCSIEELGQFFLTPLDQVSLQEKDAKKLINILIQYGADQKKAQFFSPLHFMTLYQNENGIKELLDKGANIDQQDFKGYTPLNMACQSQLFDSARWLLEKNANPNLANLEKMAPMDYCYETQNKKLALLLIQYNSNKFKKKIWLNNAEISRSKNDRENLANYTKEYSSEISIEMDQTGIHLTGPHKNW